MKKKKLLSYDEIIEICREDGIKVTWRKLNYYKTIGLLPKSKRVHKDKRGFYDEKILGDLMSIHFLQSFIGFTLEEIKKIKKLIDTLVGGDEEVSGFTKFVDLAYTATFIYVSDSFNEQIKKKNKLRSEKKKEVYNVVEVLMYVNKLYKHQLKEHLNKLKEYVDSNNQNDLNKRIQSWVLSK